MQATFMPSSKKRPKTVFWFCWQLPQDSNRKVFRQVGATHEDVRQRGRSSNGGNRGPEGSTACWSRSIPGRSAAEFRGRQATCAAPESIGVADAVQQAVRKRATADCIGESQRSGNTRPSGVDTMRRSILIQTVPMSIYTGCAAASVYARVALLARRMGSGRHGHQINAGDRPNNIPDVGRGTVSNIVFSGHGGSTGYQALSDFKN